jgi:hypothetical protein
VAIHIRDERIFDPVLEYFHTVAKHRIRVTQQGILKDIQQEASNG